MCMHVSMCCSGCFVLPAGPEGPRRPFQGVITSGDLKGRNRLPVLKPSPFAVCNVQTLRKSPFESPSSKVPSKSPSLSLASNSPFAKSHRKVPSVAARTLRAATARATAPRAAWLGGARARRPRPPRTAAAGRRIARRTARAPAPEQRIDIHKSLRGESTLKLPVPRNHGSDSIKHVAIPRNRGFTTPIMFCVEQSGTGQTRDCSASGGSPSAARAARKSQVFFLLDLP
jgi:hypothetical protein